MRNEENRNAAGPEFVNLAHASLAEIDVAHGQGFVDEEDFGIEVNGHREGEADDHAARVSFDGLVDEIANLGKVRDVCKAAIHIFSRETEDGAVEIDVFAARKLRVESGAQLK